MRRGWGPGFGLSWGEVLIDDYPDMPPFIPVFFPEPSRVVEGPRYSIPVSVTE